MSASSTEISLPPESWLGGRVFQAENSPRRTAILDAILTIAKENDATPSHVAIAWVAAKGSLPIIGPRTVAQLEDNLAATKVQLTGGQLAKLDEVSAIPDIFPYRPLNSRETRQRIAGGKLDQLDGPVRSVA